MKNIKKYTCLILSAALLLAFVACSNSEGDIEVSVGGDSSESSDATTSQAISVGRNADIALAKCISDQVNVRSGPGTDHGIVGTANVNTYYKYIVTEGDWNKIIFNNQEAYISANFTQIDSMKISDAEPIMKGIAVTPPVVDPNAGVSSTPDTDASSTPGAESSSSTPDVSVPTIQVTPTPEPPGTGEDGQVNRLDPES